MNQAARDGVIAFGVIRCDNVTMKDRDTSRHPGPMRFMRVDAEFAGILVAVGFVVMGVVGLPIAKWFLLAALVLAVAVALLLRLIRKR